MSYKTTYFSIKELVPSNMFKTNYSSFLWRLFDDRILIVADELRKLYGPLVCNNWHCGGCFELRGFRPADCAVGSGFSQHRFGRALDLVPLHCTVDEIRDDLRKISKSKNVNKNLNHITRCEDDVSWLHVDVANFSHGDCIYFFTS